MSITHTTAEPTTTARGGGPILVGVEGSPASEVALSWAAEEAEARGGALHLVHAHPVQIGYTASTAALAVPRPENDEVLVAALAQVPRLAGSGHVTTSTFGGSATTVLVDGSAEASLVVVGAPSHGAVGSAVLGSTAVEVAARAHCPVVVVRPGPAARTCTRGVVVGSDGSPTSEGALEEGLRRAQRLGLPVTVVHAWSMEYFGPALTMPELEHERRRVGERARAAIAAAVSEASTRYPEVTVQQEVIHGDPLEVLTDLSRGAETLVVGTHGRQEIAGLLLGSVSQGLLRHAECPVVVVRAEASPR